MTTDNFRQLIILDEEFKIMKSDDRIFPTTELRAIPVEKWFPFIESIYQTLLDIPLQNEDIQFSRVESPAPFLPGNYDFIFSKTKIDDREYIVWYIYDYTKVYAYLHKYQQLKNELDIHRQQLEHRSKNITKIQDLFS